MTWPARPAEREQAAVLILPAEAADACLARGFQYGNLNGLAMDPSAADEHLALGDGQQRAVIDRFDKAVPQGIQRGPQRSDVFRDRHVFLRLWNERAIVDDRPS
jgi:hypothetical protein